MSVILNGSSQFLYAAQAVITGPPFTVAGLFKPAAAVGGTLFAADIASTSGYKIAGGCDAFGTLGAVRCFPYNGTAFGVASSTTNWGAGTWQHFAAVFTSDSLRSVFLNGSSKGSNTDVITPVSADEFILGVRRRTSPIGYFPGRLCHVAVWNVALSDEEIAQLNVERVPLGVRPGSIIAYWTLISDGQDSVGSFDLTGSGSPTYDPADNDVYPMVGGFFEPERLEDIPDPGLSSFGFEELDGKLYAVHGANAFVYDPGTGHWSTIANPPLPSNNQSSIMRAVNGKLYFIGGHTSIPSVYYDTVYEYDPSLDTWTLKDGRMPVAMEDMGSAVLGGKIYIFGGLGVAHTMPDKVYIYDPVADSWETKDWAESRVLGDYATSHDGKAYLVGGAETMFGYVFPTNVTPTNKTTVYDPVLHQFTAKTPLPVPMCYNEPQELNGLIYTFSGCTTNFAVIQEDHVYDIALDLWKVRPNFSYKNMSISCTKYDGKVYFAGGFEVGVGNVKFLYRLSPLRSEDMSGATGVLSQYDPTSPPPVGAARYNAFNLQLDQDRS